MSNENKKIKGKPGPKPIFTAEVIKTELEAMLEHAKTVPNTMYMTQLCVRRGYSPQTFAIRCRKFKDEAWFRELHSLIKAILHVNLMELGITDPKLATMVIWMDKVNYGSHESAADNEKNVTINIKQETL